jgi:LacI family transcriptional regulator
MRASLRIAVITSPLNLHRIGSGLAIQSSRGIDFRPINASGQLTEILRLLNDWKPDGVITEYREELMEALIGLQLPTVVLLMDLLTAGDKTGCVLIDDEATGAMAADHLIAKGFRHIAYFDWDLPQSQERLDGFSKRLATFGIEPLVLLQTSDNWIETSDYWQFPQGKVLRWLNKLPRPTGLFAAHDSLGRVIIDACNRLSLNVPDDVAIITTGGDSIASQRCFPQLTTVDIPWSQLGSTAVNMLRNWTATTNKSKRVNHSRIEPSGVTMRGSTNVVATTNPMLRQAIQIATDQLSSGLNVAEWAVLLNTNRRTLERTFRQELNQSPHEALIRLRVEKARELLRVQPKLSMIEISDQCGFSSAEKLSIHFKQITGKTPSSARRHTLPVV